LPKRQLRDLSYSNFATPDDRQNNKALSEGIDISGKCGGIIRGLMFQNAVAKIQISWDVTLRLLAEKFPTFRCVVVS
jgi:hypothetical protein